MKKAKWSNDRHALRRGRIVWTRWCRSTGRFQVVHTHVPILALPRIRRRGGNRGDRFLLLSSLLCLPPPTIPRLRQSRAALSRGFPNHLRAAALPSRGLARVEEAGHDAF